jgi:hypothetical protein
MFIHKSHILKMSSVYAADAILQWLEEIADANYLQILAELATYGFTTLTLRPSSTQLRHWFRFCRDERACWVARIANGSIRATDELWDYLEFVFLLEDLRTLFCRQRRRSREFQRLQTQREPYYF